MATARERRAGIRTIATQGVTLVETPDLLRGALRSGWDLWNTLNRIHWMRDKQFDLVHAFEARPIVLFPSLYFRQKHQIPLIMDWCDWFGKGGSVEERPNPVIRTILRPVETFFEERFRTKADGTTVINHTLEVKAQELGVGAETILRLPNGSAPERFVQLDIPEARRITGLDAGAQVIGYLGSIFKQDADLMNQAFEYVIDLLPKAHLVVIGECPFDLREISRHPQAITQTGYVSEETMNAFLAACDVFWLPLRNTNANRGRMPLKLNDYMSVGRPIVTTEIGEVAEIVNREKIGYTSPDEPQPFADQTIRLILDSDNRETMGRRARELAETRYHWANITEELAAFYEKIIEKSALERDKTNLTEVD
jgi:glycosyltransferase involved in cell wall biosynthesis